MPTVHSWYLRDEAVAAFRGSKGPGLFCDGQFAVLPSAILCFVTVGQTTDEPHVLTPSHVVWRPAVDIKPSSRIDWLPADVRNVGERVGNTFRRTRNHHIFLRTKEEDRFFYAGIAHLGSYGSEKTTSGDWGLAADFALDQKLPRNAWLTYGGYSGWMVEVNHRCHRVDADDARSFERLVGKLASEPFSHLCMTRYEEDSLTVHTNAQRGWLMYLREPDDGGIYTRDLAYAGPPESEEHFQCSCGISLEFPAWQTLPRELAERAAIEFFQTGTLPTCVDWEPG